MDDVTKKLWQAEPGELAEESAGAEECMPVAATYARGASTVDRQIAAAKAYAAAHDLDLRRTYVDQGGSGATIVGRTDLERLLADARCGAFKVLISEPDRLSRSLSDLLSICEELRVLGVSLHAPGRGPLTLSDVVIYGYLGDAETTRFAELGNAGRRHAAAQGRLLSSVFGYRRHPDRPGESMIDDAKARIVQHIFDRLAAGASPSSIARQLTAEGVPIKTASQVRKIARCPTYTGVIVWGRTTSTRDQNTGRRVRRPVARDRWIVATRDDLAIVSRELWTRVAASLDARSPR